MHTLMTKAAAAAIVDRQKRGQPVKALLLQEAILCLGGRREKKVTLPPLARAVRERVNAVLLFNLGRCLQRKAA